MTPTEMHTLARRMGPKEMGRMMAKFAAELNQIGAEAKQEGLDDLADDYAEARDKAQDAAVILT